MSGLDSERTKRVLPLSPLRHLALFTIACLGCRAPLPKLGDAGTAPPDLSVGGRDLAAEPTDLATAGTPDLAIVPISHLQ